jgi:hypothetical protein
VARIGAGANEVVERDLERIAQRFERRRIPVDEVPSGQACCFGAEHVLQRMVIRATEEAHLSARGASLPGEHVALDQFVARAGALTYGIETVV